MRNTIWIIVVGTPHPDRVRDRLRDGAHRGRSAGARALPDDLLRADDGPGVAATLGFVFLLNPAGPIDAVLRLAPRAHSRCGSRTPHWSKPGLVLLGLWGIGNTMIIFLAALLDVPRAAVRGGRHRGRRRRGSGSAHVTLPMISPGHLLLARHRRDLRVPVLHRGLRRVAAASPNSLGDPQGSLLFYAIWLYEQGFQSFHMGYASAMAWVLFLIIMVCTLVLIRTSRTAGSTTREASDSRPSRRPARSRPRRPTRVPRPRAAGRPAPAVPAERRQPLGGDRPRASSS